MSGTSGVECNGLLPRGREGLVATKAPYASGRLGGEGLGRVGDWPIPPEIGTCSLGMAGGCHVAATTRYW